MKKAVLITIIAAIGMILVGGAMAFVSLAASGFNITNMMNTVEYEEKTVILSEDFSNMRVEMGNHDIEFLKSTDEDTHFVYYQNENEEFDVAVNGNTLEIVNRQKTSVNGMNRIFVMDLNDNSCKLYLPKDVYENLTASVGSGDMTSAIPVSFADVKIELGSGDLAFENAKTNNFAARAGSGEISVKNTDSEEFDVHTGSGDITLQTIGANNLSVEASSGDIQVNGAAVNELFYAKATSGEISCMEITCKDADVKTTSGSISADHVQCVGDFEGKVTSGSAGLAEVVADGNFKVKTVSGSINLNYCDGANMELQAGSGSVKGTIKTGKIFEATAGSGTVSVPANDENGGKCVIHTGSGDIRIEIASGE